MNRINRKLNCILVISAVLITALTTGCEPKNDKQPENVTPALTSSVQTENTETKDTATESSGKNKDSESKTASSSKNNDESKKSEASKSTSESKNASSVKNTTESRKQESSAVENNTSENNTTQTDSMTEEDVNDIEDLMSALEELDTEITLPFVPYEPKGITGNANSSSAPDNNSDASSARTYTIDGEAYTPDENETPILRVP